MGKVNEEENVSGEMFWNLGNILRKLFFSVLSTGHVPTHISFILDGNRRYAKKQRLSDGAGHNAGFVAVINMLKYCYELGIKYVSIYAFSIDNYKRKPDQVDLLMNLMAIKMEEMADVHGLLQQLNVRVYFAGNLDLLQQPLKEAAEKLMAVTSGNSKAVLVVCLAYASTDEIIHSLQRCEEEDEEGNRDGIRMDTVEKFMYTGRAPAPDILVRTSGETRLSNFLLWQTACCMLYSPTALWPEIKWWHLAWAVLKFQRHYPYLYRKKHLERIMLLPLM